MPDRVSTAGTTVFGALAVILTFASQALGLNFPVVPYLQFDFGEVAILLALFVFGPVPALISSFIEFVTLMVVGQNVPIGPVLKLLAIASSLAGIWAGVKVASKLGRPSVSKALVGGAILGTAARAAIMTVPNYYLLAYVYGITAGFVGFLAPSFTIVGVTLSETNAIVLILVFTAIFNALQLLFVWAVSYVVVESPQLKSARVGGKSLWIRTLVKAATAREEHPAT